jgi:type II secretory pathway component GspD/PulD (secretin)
MQQSVRMWGTVVAVLALVVASAAAAQDDASQLLRKAADLAKQQEYVAAQEMLGKVDRDKLGADEQGQFDELKQTLPPAVAGAAKAADDLSKADQAFDEGRWDAADALYQAVQDSKYVKPATKEKAGDQRRLVADKKRLAQAAEPSGVVEGKPAEAAAQEPAKAAASQPTTPAREADSQRPTPLTEMQQRDNLLWQRAAAQAQDLAARAREAVTQKKFTEARQLAEFALQKVEAAKSYAEPVSKYLAAKEAAENLKQEVAQAAEANQIEQAEKDRKEIAERAKKRTALMEQARRDKVEQLFNTASQLRKQQKFAEAAEVTRQILHIDPTNAKARAELEVMEDYDSLLTQRNWQDDLTRNARQAMINAQEALVPWDYEVLYPKNWLELTRKRSAAGVGSGGEEEDAELNRKLNEVLPEFQFQDAPFEAVVEHLQAISKGINIAVDWEDLTASGIEKEKPVSLTLRNLPFRTVLKELLTHVGGDTPLAFSVGTGLLRIATKAKLDKEKHVLVYDIRDLLIDMPNFTNAARMDPSQMMQNMGSGQGGGGGGQQLFQGGMGNEQRNQQGQTNTGDMVQRIMEIIRQTVEPDSWQETGGGDGSIRELNGQLIIYNTSDAHGQIRGLLGQLRASQALQIAMEARFLNVTSNFLQEFGVDLDFVFNSGTAGYDPGINPAGQSLVDPFTGASVLVPRTFSRIGSTPLTPGFGNPMAPTALGQPYGQAGLVPPNSGMWPHMNEMTPVSANQGSLALVDPSQLNTGVPGSFAQRVTDPALRLAGSFLDNLQVDFLIRATQANQRSSIVQAPRLVMFNGQRANITIANGRQYVASVEPVVAEGVASVRPITGQAQSGTVLDVQGTISADRRYVTLTVMTTQADEPQFTRFEVQRASGSSPGIFQLLPAQAWVTVNTTVNIPDGGTVLLGGMKQLGDIEVEAGVPILSDIPILKRAFSNKSAVKDTRTLLILMKAKVIIQKEAEDEAFPTYSSTSGS